MSVQKAILVELFAILLVLYGGLLNIIVRLRTEGLWLMTIGLFIGLFAAIQGIFTAPSSPDLGLSTDTETDTDTDLEGVRDEITAWIAGIFLLSVIVVVGVGIVMIGRTLGLSFGTYVGGIGGAIVAFLGIAWAYYG